MESRRAFSFPRGRWIDLTHEFSSETLYWPTSEGFRLESTVDRRKTRYYVAANRFSAAEHGGTHVDAPGHLWEGGRTVEEIPLERLIGPAAVVDVSEKASKDRDYRIGVDDFARWEEEHGRIPVAAIVLLRTGSAGHWPEARRYMGTDRRGEGARYELHFPGLGPEGAAWLVENRTVNAVGIDTPGIDYGQFVAAGRQPETHQILFREDIPVCENLNLEELPAAGALVVGLPMKIKGASGAPLRIVALVPDPAQA